MVDSNVSVISVICTSIECVLRRSSFSIRNTTLSTLSVSSIIYSTVSKNTFDTSKITFNSFCELNFPTPLMYLDKKDDAIKLQITKSIDYTEITEML